MEAVIRSDVMCKLMGMVRRVAPSLASVLITGETGSGKELIARAVHFHSLRASKPWVDVNCAALPENLVESELFGYEKGAFSGADTSKPGLFELANGGSLFLDEIGELEPRIQVKLLRVLDGVPYYRLGGSRKVSVDVRIIAATNQPLEEAVKAGRFRSDLYHRLGQIQLKVPPLRQRGEEVIPLAEYFLRQLGKQLRFSPGAQKVMRAYSWPGNVRELRNVVIHASAVSEHDEIGVEDLPEEITAAAAAPGEPGNEQSPADLDGMERQAILAALERSGGHQGAAAEQLGISRRTLSRKLTQYRIAARRADGGPQPLGVLGASEQHYFRAGATVPVTISTAGGQSITARTANISVGGLAVEGVEKPLQLSGRLTLELNLPDGGPTIQALGKLVWADGRGRAGIHFTEVAEETQRQLRSWLTRKQQEEGWTAQA